LDVWQYFLVINPWLEFESYPGVIYWLWLKERKLCTDSRLLRRTLLENGVTLKNEKNKKSWCYNARASCNIVVCCLFLGQNLWQNDS